MRADRGIPHENEANAALLHGGSDAPGSADACSNPPGSHVPSDTAAHALLERVRAGDRVAAAEFALRYGPLLKRRLAGKMGARLRRHFDSADILSTVLRRLDLYVEKGRMRAASEAELWSLVVRIAERALLDKVRIMERLRSVEAADGSLAREIAGRLGEPGAEEWPDAADLELAKLFDALHSDNDRQILWHWLSGHPHNLTAELIGMTPDAVRQRWVVIRKHLQERLGAERPQ